MLYPEWAELVGFADAAAPMVHDHDAIVARIDRLEAADAGDADTLQELLYGLYAVISVHFRKEEDLQLPAFDAAPRSLSGCWNGWASPPATITRTDQAPPDS